MKRSDGRKLKQEREITLVEGFNEWAEGSVFISAGKTKINITASVEEKLPPHLRGGKTGWITAEYAMLPRAGQRRNIRPISRGKPDPRSNEIQRLIGRILRAASILDNLGPRTLWVDCDVIQADGSTRTTAINGAFLACKIAERKIQAKKLIASPVFEKELAAVSIGIMEGKILLDPTAEEDKRLSADINLVLFSSGEIIDISGGAETEPFTRKTRYRHHGLDGIPAPKLYQSFLTRRFSGGDYTRHLHKITIPTYFSATGFGGTSSLTPRPARLVSVPPTLSYHDLYNYSF